nr:DNA mismatch repair protein MutS [uncultured Caproiciproducens sp.]
MKVHLMHCDTDFNLQAKSCFGKDTLIADLEFSRIISTMAQGDTIIQDVCNSALFCPLQTAKEIRYRQDVLQDCIDNPEVVRKLYAVTIETMERKHESWSWLSTRQNLSSNFSSAVNLLKIYTEMLQKMRNVAGMNMQNFQSQGLRNFSSMLWSELDDHYFSQISSILNELKDGTGMLISAKLGNYNQGINYVMRRKEKTHFWRHWHFAPSFTLAPRDDAGASDLSNRRARAINESVNVLAQSAEHVESFFSILQKELAFYVGCLNLYDKLQALGMPVCIPKLLPSESESRVYDTLYDVSLALTKDSSVMGNELHAEDKRLYIITGANQGGKSTLLRSIGQAQLLMQCGMFVGAESYQAPIRNGVFTHFKKEEDTTMTSGKLDEELARMSEVANHLIPGSLMLLNESFAATNEREGSEICRQITKALVDNGVEVFFVTHLYTFAVAFLDMKYSNVQYLSAQRLQNGERTFKVIPGKPLQTAYGEDLYQKIFCSEAV